VLSVVGASLTRLIVYQSRAFEQQSRSRQARAVTRAAVNMLQSELRMVDANGGVAAATNRSITVRLPYAMGVICDKETISLLPSDSVMYAQADFSGYAWRDSATGQYSYVESGATVSAGTTADCTAAGITTLTGGQVVNISPALPVEATIVGSNILLEQRVTYSFGASQMLPGRYGLFRTPAATGVAEELAAPFDSANTQFNFYNLNADAAQTAVPTLSNIRGIELYLTGASETIPPGKPTYATATIVTAVFFGNRTN
jgi:hypothetical protein